VSQQAEVLLGYELAEWYEPDFWKNHIHPEDQTWAVEFCFFHSQNMQPHDFEYRFIAKDGSVRWLRDIVNIVVEDGKPTLLRGIMLDITKQKNADKLILDAYERLSQLERYVNHSTDAIQVADEEGNLVYINQTASERLGIPQKEAHLHKVMEFEQRFSEDLDWKQHIEDLKKADFLMIEGINKHKGTGKTFL
jgi:PAS domain S-box-containing protein